MRCARCVWKKRARERTYRKRERERENEQTKIKATNKPNDAHKTGRTGGERAGDENDNDRSVGVGREKRKVGRKSRCCMSRSIHPF